MDNGANEGSGKNKSMPLETGECCHPFINTPIDGLKHASENPVSFSWLGSKNLLPEIGTYSEVAAYLRYSRKTLYKLVCNKEFKKGVYLGGGRFNMDKLRKCIEMEGTFLVNRFPKKKAS